MKNVLNVLTVALSECLVDCSTQTQQAVMTAWRDAYLAGEVEKARLLMYQYLPLIYKQHSRTVQDWTLFENCEGSSALTDPDVLQLCTLLNDKEQERGSLSYTAAQSARLKEVNPQAYNAAVDFRLTLSLAMYRDADFNYRRMYREIWAQVFENVPEILEPLVKGANHIDQEEVKEAQSSVSLKAPRGRKAVQAGPQEWIRVKVIMPLTLKVGRDRRNVLEHYRHLSCVADAADRLQQSFTEFMKDEYLSTPRENVIGEGNWEEGTIGVSVSIPRNALAAFKAELKGSITDGWGEGAEQDTFYIKSLDAEAHFPVSKFKATFMLLKS